MAAEAELPNLVPPLSEALLCAVWLAWSWRGLGPFWRPVPPLRPLQFAVPLTHLPSRLPSRRSGLTGAEKAVVEHTGRRP